MRSHFLTRCLLDTPRCTTQPSCCRPVRPRGLKPAPHLPSSGHHTTQPVYQLFLPVANNTSKFGLMLPPPNPHPQKTASVICARHVLPQVPPRLLCKSDPRRSTAAAWVQLPMDHAFLGSLRAKSVSQHFAYSRHKARYSTSGTESCQLVLSAVVARREVPYTTFPETRGLHRLILCGLLWSAAHRDASAFTRP